MKFGWTFLTQKLGTRSRFDPSPFGQGLGVERSMIEHSRLESGARALPPAVTRLAPRQESGPGQRAEPSDKIRVEPKWC